MGPRCAAGRRGSVQIPGRVEDRCIQGIGSVTPASKAVQHLLMAAAIDLEHRSIAINTAEPRRAVDVSRGIQGDAAERAGPVLAIGKAVENSLPAIGAYSEYGSAALAIASSAAVLRGAVEISFGVLHQSRVRPGTIRSASEAVDYRLIAGLIHHENRPVGVRAAIPSCAIQVAGCIQNQSCRGIPSVVRSAKTVQDGFCAAGVELKDRSAAVKIDVASRAGSAEKGGSIEIAGCIPGHTGLWRTPVRQGAAAVEWVKLGECLCRRRSDYEQSWQKRQQPNKKGGNRATFARNPVSTLRYRHKAFLFDPRRNSGSAGTGVDQCENIRYKPSS